MRHVVMRTRPLWHFSCSRHGAARFARQYHCTKGDQDEHKKHRNHLNARVRACHRRTCAARRCSAEHTATASAGVASGDVGKIGHSRYRNVINASNTTNPNRACHATAAPRDTTSNTSADDTTSDHTASDHTIGPTAHTARRAAGEFDANTTGKRTRRERANYRFVLDPEIRADHGR